MTKNKIIYEHYNPGTKETTIIIKNKFGTFKGVAKLGEDEDNYNSTYAGGRYAELKAKCKYYKYRAKLAVDKRSNYVELYNSLHNSGEDYKSSAMRKIRKSVHICEREVKYWMQRCAYEWKTLDDAETNRRDRIDKYKNKENTQATRDAIKKLINEKFDENTELDKKD